MRFWCVKQFKYWEDDKLIAHYLPGSHGYNCVQGKKNHDRLHVMLLGGTLPEGDYTLYVTEKGQPAVEYKAGTEVKGWVKEQRMTLIPPEDAEGLGTVAGSGVAG